MRSRALLLLLTACRAPAEEPPPAVAAAPRIDACDATSRAVLGGGCSPVGVAECPPGTVMRDGGCAATVPTCTEGLAAPGEGSCHEVGPCGDGPYGAFPASAAAIYVDGSYTGVDEEGSRTKPFKTVQKGVDRAAPGQIVAVAAGTYREDVTIYKTGTVVWGRCPSMTIIEGVGTGALDASISIVRGSMEVHDLAVRGTGIEILYTKGSVLLDRVHVHDTSERGIRIEGRAGETNTVTIKRSLIERATIAGVMAYASTVTIEDSVIRETRQGNKMGVGVLAAADPAFTAGSSVTLRRSLIERTLRSGAGVDASALVLESSVVRDIRPAPAEAGAGGIGVTCNASKGKGAVTLDRAVVESVEGAGIWPTQCQTVVRDSTIRGVRPRAATGDIGIGLQIDLGSALVERSSVLDCPYAGILSFGASTSIAGSLIARGAGNASGGGVGVWSVPQPTPRIAGELQMKDSLVLSARIAGIVSAGVQAHVSACEVRGVLPDRVTGGFGDGVSVSPFDDETRGQLTFERSVARASARAGLNVAAGDLVLSASMLLCNAFDLEVDRNYAGDDAEKRTAEFSLEDRGGNLCGCKTLTPCRAHSNSLDPVPTRAK